MFNIYNEVEQSICKGNQILKECLKNNYIEPHIYNIEFKQKSKSYWAKIGKNSKKHSGYFLRIGGLFNLIPDEKIAKIRLQSTIIHELIHTIPGCMNHGEKFHYICNLVNKIYPQYKLQTSTGAEDFGIQLEERKPKYVVKCNNCGKEYLYFKKPKYDLTKYSCTSCRSTQLIIFPYVTNHISW